MIRTCSQGRADAHMPQEALVQSLQTVRRHPWWRSRASLAVAALRRYGVAPPASILDVGCGWGVTLQALEQAGYRVAGLDISRRILELIDRPNRLLIEADLMAEAPSGLEPSDAVLALDVLEHLDDDRTAVQRLAQLVRPGGLVVLSAPALPELFSDFDAIQGHRRRYLPETLRGAFVGSGLTVQQVFWWGAWMVPVLRRMRQRDLDCQSPRRTYLDYLRLPPWPGPWIMTLAFAWEKQRALEGRLSTGTSLFAAAQRPAN